jgi:transposase
MPRLAESTRSEAIGMLRAGVSYSAIARRFNCHHTTIMRLEQRFLATGTVRDRPRSGQPRVTTGRQDATLRMLHRRYRFRSAAHSSRRMLGVHGQVKISYISFKFKKKNCTGH